MSETIPRRSRVDLYTPAELAIRDAIHAVEAAGAHPHLTKAVVLLGQARDAAADFVDGVPVATPEPVAEPAPSLQQRVRAWSKHEHSTHEGLQIFSAQEAISALIYRALHPSPHLWRAAGDKQQTGVLVDAAIALLTIADLRELDLVAEIEKRIAK